MAVPLHVRSEVFLECLREARYYDAHEVLEGLWFPRRFENSSDVFLLRGLINAAVSFELLKRGRVEASKRVWKNYLKHRSLVAHTAVAERPLFQKMMDAVELIHQRCP